MANAVKKISVQRGHDVTGYALNSFGGAGGQHACAVADALGVDTVIVPPLAGVLSAYGIGLADATAMLEQSVEAELDEETCARVGTLCDELAGRTRAELRDDNVPDDAITTHARVLLRYAGTDASLPVPLEGAAAMRESFTSAHRARYAFTMDKPLVVEAVSVEAVGTAGEHGAHVVEETEGGASSRHGPAFRCSWKVSGRRCRCTGAPTSGTATPSKGPRSSPSPTPPRSSTPAGGPRRTRAVICF